MSAVNEIKKIQARKSGRDYLISKGWTRQNTVWCTPNGKPRCRNTLTALMVQAREFENTPKEKWDLKIGFDCNE